MPKLFYFVLFSAAAFAQAPAGFTVVQATSKQVQLSWTASAPAPLGYIVERKTLVGEFAALLAGPDPMAAGYTDATIAPYETYVYRVRARVSATVLSTPSKPFTVGPPPVGLSLASPLAPAVKAYTLSSVSNFGMRLRAALDANGDVAFAYLVYSPQEDAEKSVVAFVSWNRAAYRWNAPRQIVTPGNILGSGAEDKPMSLARDAATNTWGLAYVKNGGGNPWVALSKDGGETWVNKQAFECGESPCRQIALAMGDGKAFLITLRPPEGVRYITSSLGDEPAKWKSEIVPKPKGGAEAISPFDIAIDSANRPGIAYWFNADSYNLILAYWRPGAAPLIALDTRNFQTDNPDVDLEYFGTKARIVAGARRTEDYFAKYDQNLWVVKEQAGAFSTPVNLPSDGNVTLGYPALAVGSAGQLAVAATEVGGTGDGVRCGLMKLIEQNKEGEGWRACSPIGREKAGFYDVNYPRVIFAPNDSRYVVFTNTGAETRLPGVVVWRER